MVRYDHIPITSRDRLGRYYTEQNISNFLVSFMDTDFAKNILDLGSGLGSLSSAAAKRWLNATIFSLDIEKKIGAPHSNNESRQHFIGDALRYNLPYTMGLAEGSIDIAVCNPPYLSPKWQEDYQQLVNHIGINKYFSISKACSSEILFLAQTIRMLKKGGEAGIILPDGIFSADRFREFREFLINEHCVKKIIQLPRRIFKRTEAKTHILIFNKGISHIDSAIELKNINELGDISNAISISKKEGIDRLDYSYYKLKNTPLNKLNNVLSISQIADIKRGKLSSKETRQLKEITIHTTDITGFNFQLKLQGKKMLLSLKNRKFIIAQPGDILISRVGRNFYKKIALIHHGYAIISDCIFIIRTGKKFAIQVYNYLISPAGQQTLNSLSYGVAATQISMKQISNIRIETLCQ